MNNIRNHQSAVPIPLPAGFQYPPGFLTPLESGIYPDIKPWWFLNQTPDLLTYWTNILKEQYPERNLVPLAKDAGSDDVFCFDGSDTTGNPKVRIIHAFAGPGWEDRGYFESYEEWLDAAFEQAKEFRQVES